MKFLELDKKRHTIKTFNDKPVDYKDLRAATEVATLAPGADNIQPWKFVAVEDRKAKLTEHLPEIDKEQMEQAQYVVVISTDTGLVQHSRKVARIGVRSLGNDMLGHYVKTLPARFTEFNDRCKGEYPALSAGIVAVNLILALADQDISSNTILGFDKSSTNDILGIGKRLRPGLLIAVGHSDNKPEPNYRLPVDKTIERH